MSVIQSPLKIIRQPSLWKRQIEFENQQQRSRILEIKSSVGFVNTQSLEKRSSQHSINRGKKNMLMEQKNTEIERENHILLRKITSLMVPRKQMRRGKRNLISNNKRSKSPQNNDQGLNSPGSMNKIIRRKQLEEIHSENLRLLTKIKESKSSYRTKQFENDFQFSNMMKSKLCLYPLNQPKTSYNNRSQNFNCSNKNSPLNLTKKRSSSNAHQSKKPSLYIDGQEFQSNQYFFENDGIQSNKNNTQNYFQTQKLPQTSYSTKNETMPDINQYNFRNLGRNLSNKKLKSKPTKFRERNYTEMDKSIQILNDPSIQENYLNNLIYFKIKKIQNQKCFVSIKLFDDVYIIDVSIKNQNNYSMKINKEKTEQFIQNECQNNIEEFVSRLRILNNQLIILSFNSNPKDFNQESNRTVYAQRNHQEPPNINNSYKQLVIQPEDDFQNHFTQGQNIIY